MNTRLEAALTELVEALVEVARTEAAAGPTTPDRLLSVDEAAAAMSCGRSLVYDLISSGRLWSLHVGRRRLIPASAIRDFIEAERS